MHINESTTRSFFTVVLCSLLFAVGAVGQEEEAEATEETAGSEEVTSITTGDPQVPLDDLKWMLFPLELAEVEAEAEAWKAILKEKVQEIADTEMAAKYAIAPEEPEDAATESEESAAPDAETDGEAAPEDVEESVDARQRYLNRLTELRAERTAIIDRYNMVLAAYERRGGDPAQHKTYRDAVSAIQIDVSDTSAAWTSISGWAKSEEGGLRFARNAGMFIVTIVGFWFAAIIIGRIVERLLRSTRNITTLMQNFVAKSVRRIVLVIGVIVGLSALEVDIGPLLAMIGAAGFIVAFALQDTLGNFASGIMILLYRPFDVGDFVEVGGVSGSVENLSLVSVTIKTPDNQIIVVPNNSVWGNIITNVTGSLERRVDLVFGIGYDDDMEKAKAILTDIVKKHELVLDTPEPVIRVHELADSSVNIVCRPWAKTSDYWTVYWDLTQAAKEEFDKAGISIPYPQQDVYMHQVTD